MRILFIDIDTLRPDHLGCYGYHRNTSPNIDSLAQRGVRFDQCYVTDAPCLPSRSALWSGRTGFHTGVINHGGVAADPFIQGPTRGFRDVYDATGLIPTLRRAGLRTVTVSPFGERHSAWWWYAGYNEIYNTGKGGLEIADEVTPSALQWMEQNAAQDNWFLHVNYWDPHTPYRTPAAFGNPFENDPSARLDHRRGSPALLGWVWSAQRPRTPRLRQRASFTSSAETVPACAPANGSRWSLCAAGSMGMTPASAMQTSTWVTCWMG